MRVETLFTLGSATRDAFVVQGCRFGKGEKSVAILAGMRGSELQALHVASGLVAWLAQREERLVPGREVLIVPAANPWSFNTARRFWGLDDTDINRMFPGFAEGETTQRIAAGLMKVLTGYQWGVNLTSINHPGIYRSHVRLHRTGYEDLEGARAFGLSDVHLHQPNAQETGSLNYNWQIWATKAYSLVGGRAFHAFPEQVTAQTLALRRFLVHTGVLVDDPEPPLAPPRVWSDADLTRVPVARAGLFQPLVRLGEAVEPGQTLARITDALEGTLLEEVVSPRGGRVFYSLDSPMIHSHMVAFILVGLG